MPFFPKGRRGVLFCAPIWNITRKRRRGGPLRPPVPRCGTFPHSSRRGGACPSRRVSELLRSTPGVSSCGAARRVVAPYGRHGPQRAGDPLWPPVPGCGTFPRHPVGEGLAPPAGFRNFSGQRWNFALRDGAPGRRALRAAWSAEGGRVRRPAPTTSQANHSKTDSGRPHRAAPTG